MQPSILEIVRFTSIFSLTLPLIAYVLRRKEGSTQHHIIGVLIIALALCESIAALRGSQKASTALVANFYGIVQFFLLSWFYVEVLFKKLFAKYFFIGTGVYIVTYITVLFLGEGFFDFQSSMWAVSGLILFIYAGAYNRYITLKLPAEEPYIISTFWINIANSFYFSSTMFLFIAENYFPELTGSAREIWMLHNVCNISKNVLYAVGLYKIGKNFSGIE